MKNKKVVVGYEVIIHYQNRFVLKITLENNYKYLFYLPNKTFVSFSID